MILEQRLKYTFDMVYEDLLNVDIILSLFLLSFLKKLFILIEV